MKIRSAFSIVILLISICVTSAHADSALGNQAFNIQTKAITHKYMVAANVKKTKTSSRKKYSSGVVKMSKSGICHAPSSRYYTRTKHFTPFNSLEECLQAGGRLPKK